MFTLQLPTQRAYARSWLTEEKQNGILKQNLVSLPSEAEPGQSAFLLTLWKGHSCRDKDGTVLFMKMQESVCCCLICLL